jgi:G3E family GTPase
MDNRIPITLLTGFLGSGKTTLLNKLVNHADMKDTAVVINELGEAGLDHILARTVEGEQIADNTVLLSSGCLCCTLRDELADTLRDLFFKRALSAIPQFKRLVIETTGMADPGPILANLMNQPVIGSTYRLDAVVVTIDSVYGLKQLEEHAEARKQAAVADVLLMTKIDLATPEQIRALAEKLAAINPGATQHMVPHGHIDPQAIINVGLFDAERKKPQPQRWLREVKGSPTGSPAHAKAPQGTLPQRMHDDEISSFTVTLPTPLDWDRLEPVLKQLCAMQGEKLLRLKGIIHAADQPAPFAVHAVQHTLYPPTLLTGWDEADRVSRIVIIGKGLDESDIRNKLMRI